MIGYRWLTEIHPVRVDQWHRQNLEMSPERSGQRRVTGDLFHESN